MTGVERWDFFRRHAVGLILVLLIYLLITILRSVRTDFRPQIWNGLQAKVSSHVFAMSETAVAAGVLFLIGTAVLIRDNWRAFSAGMVLAFGGAIVVVVSLLGLQIGVLPPFAFMVLNGLGMYLPYIAVHTIIFERLIAMTRDRGNMGYLMYLADAFGYLAYVVALIVLKLLQPGKDFLAFFVMLNWAIAVTCAILVIPCWRYFATHPATRSPVDPRCALPGDQGVQRLANKGLVQAGVAE